ncbi:hypothetical protein [Nocardia lijiangensis]|uniref:hypothetical protein n=1 Tax=Nocardia lijiangensis TaxID=299618 RepID=UPI00083305A8|nr:hypothetical protein [Nocardia lijiangensis]
MKIYAAAAAVVVMAGLLTTCAAGIEPDAVAAPPSAAVHVAASELVTGPGYLLDVPQVVGGDPAAAAFNAGMHAAARFWIDQVDARTTLAPGPGQVTYLGTRALSGLLSVSVDTGDASVVLRTSHVTDARTGRTLTLADLFTDLDRGLDILATCVADLLSPHTDLPASALEPAEYNYRVWLATPAGMQIHFGAPAADPAGDIVVTVPWYQLETVLAPGMRDVVGG